MGLKESMFNSYVLCGILLTINIAFSSCSQFPGKNEYTLNLTTTACFGNVSSFSSSSSSSASASSSSQCPFLSSITINGEEKSLQLDGFNIAVINPDTGTVESFHRPGFDSTSPAQKEDFEKLFVELEERSIVVIVLQNMRKDFDRLWYTLLPGNDETNIHKDYDNAIVVRCKGECPLSRLPYSYFGHHRTVNRVVQFTLSGSSNTNQKHGASRSDSLGLVCGGIIAFFFIVCIGLILYVSHKGTRAFGGTLRRPSGVEKECVGDCVVNLNEKISEDICEEKTALNPEKLSTEHIDIVSATLLDVSYKSTKSDSNIPTTTSDVPYTLPKTIPDAPYVSPQPDSKILQVPKELYADEPCKSPRPTSGAYKHIPVVPHAEKCFKSPRPNSETYQQMPADHYAEKTFKARSMSKSKTFCQGVYAGKSHRSPRSDPKTFSRHGSSRSHSEKHYKFPRSEGRTYSELSQSDSTASDATTSSDGNGKVSSLKLITG